MDSSLPITLFLLLMNWTALISSRDVAMVDGDVIISGLFDIRNSEKDECVGSVEIPSVQTYEAVKWFLQKLNERGYIPGVTMGITTYPTCRLLTVANGVTYDLINKVRNDKTDTNFRQLPLIGIIGPGYSSLAEASSLLISGLPASDRILQIGYATTAASLSDHVTYSNFFRVVPSDTIQIEAMMSLLKVLQWNYIAIIYENDVYGVGAYKTMRSRAEKEGICVGSSFSVDLGDGGSVKLIDIKNDLRDKIITNVESKISGVLVFGNSLTARAILEAADLLASTYTDKISFIFSESINLDDSAFSKEDSDGAILQSSKGSYAMSIPLVKSKDFDLHWREIFSNDTVFLDASTTNPWLEEVLLSVKSCKPSDDPNCLPLSSIELSKISKSPIFVEYALKAAAIMANVLKVLHNRECRGVPGICAELKQTLYQSKAEMINEANRIQVKFANEFQDELSCFENSSVTFNGSDAVHSETEAEYEVYNYRKCLNDESSFCLVKVGQYQNHKLDVDKSLVRDYHQSDIGTSWPNIQEATCDVASKCGSCQSEDLHNAIYLLKGDVYVVGVLPVYDKSTSNPLSCGEIRDTFSMEIVEAMVYAVETVNNKSGKYENYFQNKKVGLILINSCNQRLLTSSQILKFLNQGVPLDDGSFLSLRDNVLGFVAGYSSDISIAVSELLTPLGIVNIGYASTVVTLSNREEYGLFLRVATPDDRQITALMKVVRALGSSYIQIMYSDSLYGKEGLEGLQKAAKQFGICIANAIAVKDAKYTELVDDLRLASKARIVIVFLQSLILEDALTEVDKRMDEGEFLFIGSEAMGKNLHQVNGYNKLIGSMSLSLQIKDSLPFVTYLEQKQFMEDTQNPWIQDYYQKKNNCYFKNSFDKTFDSKCDEQARFEVSDTLEQWTPYAMNAMFALLQGTNEALTQLCGQSTSGVCQAFSKNPDVVRQKILQQRLDLNGDGEEERIFDDNGDGVIGYTIYNLQADLDTNTFKYVTVGYSSVLDDTFHLDINKLVLPRGVSDKLPTFCPNDRECNRCFPAENSTCPDKELCSSCFVKSTINLKGPDTSTTIGLGVFCALLVCVIVVLVATWYICTKRKEREEDKEETYEKPNDIYLYPIPHLDSYKEEDPNFQQSN